MSIKGKFARSEQASLLPEGEAPSDESKANAISSEDHAFLAGLLRQRSGLSITADKSRLVERRLQPVASRHGYRDVADLLRELRQATEALCQTVTDAMTIHDTAFFRDASTFAAFRDVILPEMMKTRRRRKALRIWCAGASTGQEPYSLAMILEATPRLASWTVDLIASDIDPDIVARARQGIYGRFEVQRGLPSRLLARHFQQHGEDLRLTSALRRRVQFSVFNLLDSYDVLGCFDVIFCRNVLMYFDQQSKQDVLSRLSDALAADGYLVLGAAETVMGSSKAFAPLRTAPGVYAKTGGSHSRAAMG